MTKPHTAMENESDRNEIFKYCREEQKPVFLTMDGEEEFVVMSLEHLEARLGMLETRGAILSAMVKARDGGKTYTMEEINQRMREKFHGIEEAA